MKQIEIKTEPVVDAVVETPAAEEVQAAPVKRVVPSAAKRKLTTVTKKAVATAAEKVPEIPAKEQAALEGLKLAREIAGITLKNDGKLSPFGHMASRQNGKLDIAILTMETIDFQAWCRAVAEGDQTGRRTDLEDNKGMLARMRDHFNYLGGKRTDSSEFAKRLVKVGLEKQYKALTEALKPAADLFEAYVAECAW